MDVLVSRTNERGQELRPIGPVRTDPPHPTRGGRRAPARGFEPAHPREAPQKFIGRSRRPA